MTLILMIIFVMALVAAPAALIYLGRPKPPPSKKRIPGPEDTHEV